MDLDEASVNGNALKIVLNVFAPRSVRRVVYELDGQRITERTAEPFDGTINIPTSFGSGSHTLTITAYDDIDNQRSVEQTINLN
ncbi:MAG: Ig-like domain-containing protein, partial [bacterium]|nr:Ig-like domain-containing protein [bacterium]